MLHTAESNFSNFVIEYLGEIEAEFENTLACLSGAQMGSNHEKNWGSTISWHTPFNEKYSKLFKSFEKSLRYRIECFVSKNKYRKSADTFLFLHIFTSSKLNREMALTDLIFEMGGYGAAWRGALKLRRVGGFGRHRTRGLGRGGRGCGGRHYGGRSPPLLPALRPLLYALQDTVRESILQTEQFNCVLTSELLLNFKGIG